MSRVGRRVAARALHKLSRGMALAKQGIRFPETLQGSTDVQDAVLNLVDHDGYVGALHRPAVLQSADAG